MRSLASIPLQPIVDCVRRSLLENGFKSVFVFGFHFSFGEFDVESDVEIPLGVVVVVERHAFLGLLDARSGPRDAVPLHAHKMPVEMLDGNVESRQSVL